MFALAFQVNLSFWTSHQSQSFAKQLWWQYEENTCDKGGYCNFICI
jgi:hypothetical protein